MDKTGTMSMPRVCVVTSTVCEKIVPESNEVKRLGPSNETDSSNSKINEKTAQRLLVFEDHNYSSDDEGKLIIDENRNNNNPSSCENISENDTKKTSKAVTKLINETATEKKNKDLFLKTKFIYNFSQGLAEDFAKRLFDGIVEHIQNDTLHSAVNPFKAPKRF
jgi:hypothetical protein